ncbi:MAG: CopG family transcriptional regulator [Deltaproteobacteria bacterium]|nr:MAG: CopG family transcriptional regulator [Deltaproteobacteria bacterium]
MHIDIKNEMHHYVNMAGTRTTITLDDDVAREVERLRRLEGKSLRKLINELLRRGLADGRKPSRPRRFRVQPHHCGLKAGVDHERLNQLVDQQQAGRFVESALRSSPKGPDE